MTNRINKVLIITYYWPPSGGSGVQRWLKMTKYLSRMGIECHVLTVDEKQSSYPTIDETLLDDIEPSIQIHKTQSFEPINIYSRLVGKENTPSAGFTNVDQKSLKQKAVSFIRSNLFIPDPRRGWNRYAFKKACDIIQQNDIKTIITSSPPHSTQLIGLRLKKKFNIHWIADFRDPWTDIFYYSSLQHSHLSHIINKRYEREVLNGADDLVVVGESLKKLFKEKINSAQAPKLHVIENGYDHEDFEGIKKHRTDDLFRIVYTGQLSEDYNPDVLIDSLCELNIDKTNMHIQFIGNVSETLIVKFSSRGLHTEGIGYVSHDEVVQYQKNADALLLIIPMVARDELIITGKIFEYMASGNPIIGIGPQKGDAAKILYKSGTGKMFERNQKSELTKYIQKLIIDKSSFESKNIHMFSRKYLAKKYAEIL